MTSAAHSQARVVPAQKFLPLRAELRLPTVDLAGARAILDLRENEIKSLIDCGDLVAWNIATQSSQKIERRILTVSARDFADNRKRAIEESEIIRRVYGSERPFIFGTFFFRAWNCDSGHMINLLEEGSLTKLANTDYRRGRNGTPCITWASALAFLNSRRLAC
jgi:hypothetical protein